jgi:hypothetical protein
VGRSETTHCCFRASVLDAQGQDIAEAFFDQDAKMIAEALNHYRRSSVVIPDNWCIL